MSYNLRVERYDFEATEAKCEKCLGTHEAGVPILYMHRVFRMNNRNDFASLINGDWRQRSTAKASFARNVLIVGLFFKSANQGWRFWGIFDSNSGSSLRFHILN